MLTVISSADVPADTRRGGTVQTLLSPRTVGCSSGFTGIASIGPGESIAEHYHPYSEEFVYVVSGPLDLYADGEPHTLRAGDAVVLPIGTRHRFVNTGDHAGQIVFHLGPLAPRPELGHVDTEAERLASEHAAQAAGRARSADDTLDRSAVPASPPPIAETVQLSRFWRWVATAAMGSGYATPYVDWGTIAEDRRTPGRRWYRRAT